MVMKSSILLVKPHAHDVLLGNDSVIIKHIGTVFFRRLIERCRADHMNGSLNKDGKNAAQEVFDEVKTLDPPGRFLLSTSNDFTEWYEVSNQKAMEKIRLALGDKPQSQQGLGNNNINIIADATPKQVLSNARAMSNTSLPTLSSFQSFQESVMNVPLPRATGSNNIPYSMLVSKGNETLIKHINSGHSVGSSPSLKSRTIDKHKVKPNAQFSSDSISITNSINGTDVPRSRDSSITTKQDNVHEQVVPDQASFKSNLISISDNESGISSITKETSASMLDAFSRNFFANAMNNTSSKSKRQGVCLPKIDDSYEALLTMDKVPMNSSSTSASISSMKEEHFSETPVDSSADSSSHSHSSTEKMSKKKRKAPEIPEPKKETKTKSMESMFPGNFHQQVMMPVSYIGQSFSNLKGCSDGTKEIFKEIANLGKKEVNATLFLPGIIGSLCQRIVELEREQSDSG